MFIRSKIKAMILQSEGDAGLTLTSSRAAENATQELISAAGLLLTPITRAPKPGESFPAKALYIPDARLTQPTGRRSKTSLPAPSGALPSLSPAIFKGSYRPLSPST
ncbi:MAG: hypothetical protein ACQEXV_22515 [Bacillota bacterium]